MSLKMECHSKWNVTQDEVSLKMVLSLVLGKEVDVPGGASWLWPS